MFVYHMNSWCYRVATCMYYRCLCHQYLITSHGDEASRMRKDLVGSSALLTASEGSLGIFKVCILCKCYRVATSFYGFTNKFIWHWKLSHYIDIF